MAITIEAMEKFEKDHPELSNLITTVIGTYTKCQSELVIGKDKSELFLEDMYQHVYEGDGCEKCQRRIQSHKIDFQEIFSEAAFAVLGKDHAEEIFQSSFAIEKKYGASNEEATRNAWKIVGLIATNIVRSK